LAFVLKYLPQYLTWEFVMRTTSDLAVMPHALDWQRGFTKTYSAQPYPSVTWTRVTPKVESAGKWSDGVCLTWVTKADAGDS
jgi:hypothetical protein